LSAESKAYNIARLSVTESVAWIQSLCLYIDETYKDLDVKGTFSKEKTWQLVTQLVKRIFEELAEPRSGVATIMDIKDDLQMSSSLFWPIVRTLDRMKLYSDNEFGNDATISAEYIKFLATNSGSEAATDLEKKIKKLDNLITEQGKSVKGAAASASSAANKVDEQRKALESLLKRVSKLESK
jgi:hypothetical protein